MFFRVVDFLLGSRSSIRDVFRFFCSWVELREFFLLMEVRGSVRKYFRVEVVVGVGVVMFFFCIGFLGGLGWSCYMK